MWATGLLSRCDSIGRRLGGSALLIAVWVAMLVSACGGGDGGDGVSPDASSDPPDQENALPSPLPDDDEPDPVAGPEIESGLPDDVALSQLFPESLAVEGLGVFLAQAAQATTPAQSFASLRRPDGETWNPAALAREIGVEELYEVVYAAEAGERLAIVTIELSRHDSAEGAARLVEVVREQPVAAGEARGTIAGGFPDADAVLTTNDSQGDPGAVLFATIANAQVAAVVARDENVVVRIEVVTGGVAAVARVAEALGIAVEQLQRLTAARDGVMETPLRLPFIALLVDELLAALPEEFAGFNQLEVEQDGEQVVVQYADAAGDLMIVVMNAFPDAANLLVTDFAIQQPNGLESFTGAGAAFDVIEAGPLPAATVPGLLGAAARWQVRVGELVLFDDVIAFRRASVWVVVQGVSPDAGGSAALDFAFSVDELIQDLEAER